MEQPLLSIIVPVYNAERYLGKCIDSIKTQTYTNLEIILVNDGSTDGSENICRKYAEQDTRIKLISQENAGQTAARKAGLATALGKFIGFVDSDDWIEPTMFEELTAVMVKYDCDMVSCGMFMDYADTGATKVIFDYYPEGFYNDLKKSIYPTMLYDANYKECGLRPSLDIKIFRKNLLCRIFEKTDTRIFYGEDTYICNAYCLEAQKIYIMRKAFYHYNLHQNSTCSTKNERLPYNNYLLYTALKELFTQQGNSWTFMQQLKRYVLALEVHSINLLYDINVRALGVWNFSYPNEIFHHKFVIYGAGSCGQALFRKVCEIGCQNHMAAWVDKAAERKCEECDYKLSLPCELLTIDYDVIIIAVQDFGIAENIKSELMKEYGVKEEKIQWSESTYQSVLG